MQPHLSMRKFPLMQASMMQAFVMQAQAMGFERLDQITDEVIVRMVPRPVTIQGGLGLLQDVKDQENEEATEGAMAVFVLEDAGNKKEHKLHQRMISHFSKDEGRVIVKHLAAGIVAGSLAAVITEDLARIGVVLATLRGICTDNAPDVFITLSAVFADQLPLFVGTGCELDILHILIMRPIFTAFGEQAKPGEKAHALGHGEELQHDA